MHRPLHTGWLAALAVVALCGGCQSHSFYEVMPTPNLYLEGRGDPFDAVPAALRSGDAEVIYLTDRVRGDVSKRGQEYTPQDCGRPPRSRARRNGLRAADAGGRRADKY